MNISKIALAGCVIVSVVSGVFAGFLAGKIVSDKKNQSRVEEAETMAMLWKRRAENLNDAANYVAEIVEQECENEENPKPHVSKDYTKYYSRYTGSEDDEEEVVDVVMNPRTGRNDPPRVVSQDEAMAPDSDCMELEYHIKDEALIDPNTPGKPDLIDETDAFVMIGNLLRVPDVKSLPKTVYIYCPARDQYYEIFIYDNYWDPPDEEDDAPRIEKIKKKGRFDE